MTTHMQSYYSDDEYGASRTSGQVSICGQESLIMRINRSCLSTSGSCRFTATKCFLHLTMEVSSSRKESVECPMLTILQAAERWISTALSSKQADILVFVFSFPDLWLTSQMHKNWKICLEVLDCDSRFFIGQYWLSVRSAYKQT